MDKDVLVVLATRHLPNEILFNIFKRLPRSHIPDVLWLSDNFSRLWHRLHVTVVTDDYTLGHVIHDRGIVGGKKTFTMEDNRIVREQLWNKYGCLMYDRLCDDQGYIHGLYIKRKDNGNILQMQYQHGVRWGLHKEIDELGQLHVQKYYKNNEMSGPCRHFQDGQLCLEAHYVNDVLHGPYFTWSAPRLQWRQSANNGNKEVSQLSSAVNYANGKKHGCELEYYVTGQLYLQTTYKCGKLHGHKREWSLRGKLLSDDVYYRGRRLPKPISAIISLCGR